MIIDYEIGAKKYKEEYSPNKKSEYAEREEGYVFDAALQLEMNKICRMYNDYFSAVDIEREDEVREYQFKLPKKNRIKNDTSLEDMRVRVEKLIQLFVVTPECISGMKEILEDLYTSHDERKIWYDSLGEEIRGRFDDFQMSLLGFVDRVERLLAERNSLVEPMRDWTADVTFYKDIESVSIEKLKEIINDIQEMVRGSYDEIEKYRGKIDNNVRKNYIRNKLNQIPKVFSEKVSTAFKQLSQAKKIVWGRSVSQVDNIKMAISVNDFEQKRNEIESVFLGKIKKSANCPFSFEKIREEQEEYVKLIGKLEENIQILIKINRNNNKKRYWNSKRCVALFDLNKTTRLFSLSGAQDYNMSYHNHSCWEPAAKVYDVLCEDDTHNYIWCKLTPDVKRYLTKGDDGSIQNLSKGVLFETLGSLNIGNTIPNDMKGDFSCCERKIFAYFENDLTQCDSSPKLISRWAPCELCKPAINALYNNGIYVECYYIWKNPDAYQKYLDECLEV